MGEALFLVLEFAEHLLITAPKVFTCTEAARGKPESEDTPAHDASTRLLARQPLDTASRLGRQAAAFYCW